MDRGDRLGIMVTGGYSCSNRGDWALGESAIQGLRRSGLECPSLLQTFVPMTDVPIEEAHELISMWPRWRMKWHRWGSLGSRGRYYRLQTADMRRHLASAAARLRERGATGRPLLWTCGGGIMNDVSSHGPFTARLGRVAHEAGWEVAMTGQTLGPFRGETFRDELSEFLRCCTYTSVRDPDSYEHLCSVEGLTATPRRALDDVFYTEAVPRGFGDPERYRRETGQSPPEGPFVLMTVHRQGGSTVPIDWESIFAAADAIRETGRTVVFVNFAGHAETEDPVIESWTVSRERASFVGHRVGVRTIRELAGAADLVVTTRFHGLVFALHAGTPTVCPYAGSYYRSKSFRLQEEWGLGAYALDVSTGWDPLKALSLGALEAGESLREVVAAHRPAEVGDVNPFVRERLMEQPAATTTTTMEHAS